MRVRRVAVALLTVALASSLAGCDLFHDRDWKDPVPAAVALRVDGETLEIWTGTPCEQVTRVDLAFDPGAETPVVASYRSKRPQQVETLVVGLPPTGFTASTPLPEDFDWRQYDDVAVTVYLGSDRRSVSAELGPLDDGATDGDYLVRREWLSADEVIDGDGEDYGLVC